MFIYALQADGEEAALEKEFGEAYMNYKREVPYFIPFLPSIYGWAPKIVPEHGLKRKLALTAAYLVLLVLTWLLKSVPTFHTR